MNEKIKFFLNNVQGDSLEQLLTHSSALPVWPPFDERAVKFISKFSNKLLTNPNIRTYPELAALAHWFRAARLHELKKLMHEPFNAVLRGRGLVFHLAPSNVDSVAMYSWLIALLSGNVNWVRVSQKQSEQFNFILDILKETLTTDVSERIVLLTYPHNDKVTGAISAAAMCRVVWGGDATVTAIRSIPLRPTATELCFPDRFSVAALCSRAVLDLNESELKAQAAAFYNDAFWFSQQACSSPRLLSWIGNDSDCTQAQERFWMAVQQQIKLQNPENTAAMNMNRLSSSFSLAAQNLAYPFPGQMLGTYPLRLVLERKLQATIKALHCGNGLFLEQNLGKLRDLAAQLSDKEQTLAVLGFEESELIDLIDALPPRAIDRIVPFGQALSFASTWDGIDLFTAFTRQINLPTNTRYSTNKGN